jgi:hypothetical protein
MKTSKKPPGVEYNANNHGYGHNSIESTKLTAYPVQSQQQLSVIQESTIEYEDTFHYISVESKSRDLTSYPQPQNYRIYLSQTYKNVKSVELIGGTVPDQANVSSEPYLVLKVDEFDNLESSDLNINKSFSILQLKQPNIPGGFINIDTEICSGAPKIFKTPLANLDRITISVRDYDNNTFNFGDDTAGSPPNKQFQNMFLFKIITLERKRNELNHRNIF